MAVTEWDQRELCPDGGCIGVIGADGTCSVCGRAAPGWGDERQRGLLPATSARSDGGDDDGDDDGDDGGDDDGDRSPGEAPAWTQRELCADGGCTGVLGDDGRCRACGKVPG